jgi:hypothetical protein
LQTRLRDARGVEIKQHVNNLRDTIWDSLGKFVKEDSGLPYESKRAIREWVSLLGIVGVRSSDKCGTAKIKSSNERIEIEIGERLLNKLSSPEDWVWIVGHELSHFTLGHLNGIRKEKPLTDSFWNYTFDVIIESQMFKQLNFGAEFEKELRLKPLLANGFEKRAAIGAFLVNPFVWQLANVEPETFLRERIKENKLARRAVDFYKSLYPKKPGRTALPSVQVLNELMFWFDGFIPIWLPVIGEGDTGLGKNGDDKLKNHIGGTGTVVQNEIVQTKKKSLISLSRLISRVVTFDSENTLKSRQQILTRTVIPMMGRKDAAMLGANVYPVFFSPKVSCEVESRMRPQLYIDLSGSMAEEWSAVYSLISGLSGIVGEPVWGFSGKVVPLSGREIRMGIVPITGGTEMTCVIEHASTKKYKKIIVFTDGQFAESNSTIGKISKSANVDIYLVLFGGERNRSLQRIKDCSKAHYAKEVWIA